MNQPDSDVTSALDVYVRVINLVEEEFFLKEVKLLMPGQFLAARSDSVAAKPYLPDKDIKLSSGNEWIANFNIKTQNNTSWLGTLMNPSLLTFIPAEYEVRVVVTCFVPATQTKAAQEIAIQEIIKLYFEPPLSSLLWGGVIGSILLALFLGIYRYTRTETSRTFAAEAGQASVLMIAGTLCAVIAIILLYRFKELPLPINITINDFYGGIVIGLFTFKIGDWLYSQFFSDSNKQPEKVVKP